MRGLRIPPTVVRGGPRAGISIRGTAGLTLIAAPCRIGKYGRRRNEKYIFFSTRPSRFSIGDRSAYRRTLVRPESILQQGLRHRRAVEKRTPCRPISPCEEALVERAGVRKKVRRPLISSLMFFRSTARQATEVQRVLTDKVILYTRQEGLKKIPLPFPNGR